MPGRPRREGKGAVPASFKLRQMGEGARGSPTAQASWNIRRSEREQKTHSCQLASTTAAAGAVQEHEKHQRRITPLDATTVLWEANVPMRIVQPEREERLESLSVRIAQGTQRHSGSRSQLLRVQITSERDLFVLHTLEVTEDDFQSLKTEQSILVDYNTFPSKIIELLDACIACASDDQPKFSCTLSVHSDRSVLSIIETNPFKALTHIALRFQPGDDVAVKEYLAERLNESRETSRSLRSNLDSTRSEAESLRSECSRLGDELHSEKERASRVANDMEANQRQAVAEAREKALKELEDTKTRLTGEKTELERHYSQKIDSLTKKNEELEDEVRNLFAGAFLFGCQPCHSNAIVSKSGYNIKCLVVLVLSITFRGMQRRKLLESKYGLESKVTELSSSLNSRDSELKHAREELEEIKHNNKQLDAAKHEAEKDSNQKAIRISSLEQQVTDKDENMRLMKERLDTSEAYKQSVEQALNECRQSLQQANERLSRCEEEMGNKDSKIQSLEGKLENAQWKAKLSAAVRQKQESTLSERKEYIERLEKDSEELRRQVESLSSEKSSLQSHVHDQKQKLEESQKLLKDNQEMIRWLNQQVNDVQLGRYGSSNRYSFRPSSAAASIANGAHQRPSQTSLLKQQPAA